MAWKKPERNPESGWGEGLQQFFREDVKIHNHAASGRSSRSFVSEGRWQKVKDSLQEGDFVVIQFGHNDEKPKPKLHTDPFSTFKEFLIKFIEESREKGAQPIIASSIVRRQFDDSGNLIDTHGDYITAAEEVARETNTPYIDMEALTRKMVVDLGPEKSKKIYTFSNGKRDSTHVSHYGAKKVVELFVKEVKEQNLALEEWLK